MSESYVVDGAQIHCSYGSHTGRFSVSANRGISIGDKLQGSIQDFHPQTHIPSFGKCRSMHNPAVSSANKGNSGKIIPQPCKPSVSMPWLNGKKDVYVDQSLALMSCSTNLCMWCGKISFTTDGQE
ncbi:hypothetical protein D3C74_70340 [compost metagenome]